MELKDGKKFIGVSGERHDYYYKVCGFVCGV